TLAQSEPSAKAPWTITTDGCGAAAWLPTAKRDAVMANARARALGLNMLKSPLLGGVQFQQYSTAQVSVVYPRPGASRRTSGELNGGERRHRVGGGYPGVVHGGGPEHGAAPRAVPPYCPPGAVTRTLLQWRGRPH